MNYYPGNHFNSNCFTFFIYTTARSATRATAVQRILPLYLYLHASFPFFCTFLPLFVFHTSFPLLCIFILPSPSFVILIFWLVPSFLYLHASFHFFVYYASFSLCILCILYALPSPFMVIMLPFPTFFYLHTTLPFLYFHAPFPPVAFLFSHFPLHPF